MSTKGKTHTKLKAVKIKTICLMQACRAKPRFIVVNVNTWYRNACANVKPVLVDCTLYHAFLWKLRHSTFAIHFDFFNGLLWNPYCGFLVLALIFLNYNRIAFVNIFRFLSLSLLLHEVFCIRVATRCTGACDPSVCKFI